MLNSLVPHWFLVLLRREDKKGSMTFGGAAVRSGTIKKASGVPTKRRFSSWKSSKQMTCKWFSKWLSEWLSKWLVNDLYINEHVWKSGIWSTHPFEVLISIIFFLFFVSGFFGHSKVSPYDGEARLLDTFSSQNFAESNSCNCVTFQWVDSCPCSGLP